MRNLTPKMNQPSIEINGNLNFFSNLGWWKFLKLYVNYLKYETKYFQMKI